jgi:hypothetical protein
MGSRPWRRQPSSWTLSRVRPACAPRENWATGWLGGTFLGQHKLGPLVGGGRNLVISTEELCSTEVYAPYSYTILPRGTELPS